MAMFITWEDKGNERIKRRRQWHLGESIPNLDAYVVNFQADGDELNLILNAMQATYTDSSRVHYRKGSGFLAPSRDTEYGVSKSQDKRLRAMGKPEGPTSKVAVSEGEAIEAMEKGIKVSINAKGEMYIG